MKSPALASGAWFFGADEQATSTDSTYRCPAVPSILLRHNSPWGYCTYAIHFQSLENVTLSAENADPKVNDHLPRRSTCRRNLVDGRPERSDCAGGCIVE